jgi:DNA-binding transcriptional LysR family regulator
LEFKQLEAYVKVYELKSFSRAAEALFISQPSVSAYINALENELRTQLIFRSTKEFQPTKSGTLLFEYAKDMLALRDKALVSVSSSADGSTGTIDILASSVPAQYILPQVLGAFRKQYPNIAFTLKQTDSREVVKGISQLESDIGFVGAKMDSAKCLYEDFMTEKLVMIAPYEDRYMTAEPLEPQDIARMLRDEKFVTREVGSGTRIEYEEYLEKVGIDPSKLNISTCFNSTQSIIQAVACGLGVSIVSELAARHYIQQKMVAVIPVDSLPERHFHLVLKKDCIRPAVVDTFLAFLREL